MNERIKELILESGFPKFDEMYVVTDGKELEKFAELIVRECCDVLHDSEMGGYQVNYVLKEHFGVE